MLAKFMGGLLFFVVFAILLALIWDKSYNRVHLRKTGWECTMLSVADGKEECREWRRKN